MRVALVLAATTGGIGRHARSLAAGLATCSAEVQVLAPSAADAVHGFGPAFVPLETGPLAPARLLRLLRGVDVVHAHGLRAGLMTTGVRRASPHVVSWHNPPPPGRLPARLAGLLARRTDITLAASDDLAARVLALGGRDVRVAPVGAPALAAPGRDRVAIRAELGAADRPLLLAVGRLLPQKGHDVLIAAAGRWTQRRPPPLVVIAGEGPSHASLDAAISRSGAPIRLLGRRSDVADLLAAADVVVLPSRWEARSLVAQEACRAGVPLVATSVGGLPALLGDDAVLVPSEDPDALAAAVDRLLDDPAAAAALGRRARARAQTWPTEADTVRQVAAVYRELLGERACLPR